MCEQGRQQVKGLANSFRVPAYRFSPVWSIFRIPRGESETSLKEEFCLASNMFKNTFQSGFLSILYSIGSKPLQIWDKKVRNGHIKRITDPDIQVSKTYEYVQRTKEKKLLLFKYFSWLGVHLRTLLCSRASFSRSLEQTSARHMLHARRIRARRSASRSPYFSHALMTS